MTIRQRATGRVSLDQRVEQLEKQLARMEQERAVELARHMEVVGLCLKDFAAEMAHRPEVMGKLEARLAGVRRKRVTPLPGVRLAPETRADSR